MRSHFTSLSNSSAQRKQDMPQQFTPGKKFFRLKKPRANASLSFRKPPSWLFIAYGDKSHGIELDA
jgi:hypothetical protein